MTFFFIILYKYEKKTMLFCLSRRTNSFMCARVYLVSAEHTSTYIYIYINMYVLGTLQYETVSTLS